MFDTIDIGELARQTVATANNVVVAVSLAGFFWELGKKYGRAHPDDNAENTQVTPDVKASA